MAAQAGSFRAAAALAERASAQRDPFSALLARVLGALPPAAPQLTSPEVQSAAQALGLSAQELAALAEGAAAAFRRAAAEGYNPQALGEYVAAEGGSAATASAFRDVWRAHGQALLAELRGAGWGGGAALRSVAWRVVVPLAASGAPPDAGAPPEPRAVFELALAPPPAPSHAVVAAGAAGDDDDAEPAQLPGPPTQTLAFEMTHEELGGLFDQLERIQAQLDAIA